MGKRFKTFYKQGKTTINLSDFHEQFTNATLVWFAERFIWYIHRAHASGIFANPTGTSMRAWRYEINKQSVRFFNRKTYVFYLNRGRKSQPMRWLEGKTVPIKVGNEVIFRKAIGVGRKNANSKHGRLFYMKDPDKGKPYLGYIDKAIDQAQIALKRKLKRGFSQNELKRLSRQVK